MKLKLVREIKSKEGTLHFQRYLIWENRFFNLYLHKIYEPDKDPFIHNHPWNFFGIILSGSYTEERDPIFNKNILKKRNPFSILMGGVGYFHKIKTIHEPVTTLFFTGKKRYPWGYKDIKGLFVLNFLYRQNKDKYLIEEKSDED